MNKPTWKNTLNITNENFDKMGHLFSFALAFDYDYMAHKGIVYDVKSEREVCSVEALDAEHNALIRIANEDYPPSGQFWGWGEPKSYGSAYGADGERDFLIGLAKDALGVVCNK